MRGLWVVRTALVSPEAIDRVVDQAHAAGFNALFVQVRGRGDAFYRSQVVARSDLIPARLADFDPLGRLLSRARRRGLQVHAWFNVLLTGHFSQRLASSHVLSRHPEWVMVPKRAGREVARTKGAAILDVVRRAARDDSDVEGLYLSPSSRGVGDHLESVVRELVTRYRVDGIHWDFIRYPGPRYDYSRWALEGFRRWRGNSDLWEGPERNPKAWNEYRRRAMSSLAARLSRAARGARPGLIVSAAVVPDEASAMHQKFQAWPQWLAGGVLDALCPMTYTTDARVFQRQVERASALAAGRPVWAGVAAYRQPVSQSIEKIQLARRAGAEGVLIFSHESLTAASLLRFKNEAFGPRAAVAEGGAEHRTAR